MKKVRKITAIFGLIMTILWCIVFVSILKSWIGILIGLCFGLAFAASQYMIMGATVKSKTESGKKENMNEKDSINP